ncbi:SDR family oxidoreductase [soil metagenome]
MRFGQKVALGLVGGALLAMGTRAWLRRQRRIELAGRVVLITGASSGLGFLLAQHAARRGARLVLVARDEDALRAAEPELLGLGAPEVMIAPADITDPEAVRGIVDRVIERFGRLDVLINNAALMLVGPADAMDLDDYRRLMNTNFWGGVYFTLAALPQMRARRFGRIGNVISIGGRVAAPHMLPYTASKHAFAGFTKGLYPELLRDNIFVTGAYPSTIRTGGHTNAWFKGDQQAEYTWFAASDTLPLLSGSADALADRFLESICDGDPEVPVDFKSRFATVTEALLPDWMAELNAIVEKDLLPPAVNLDGPAVQGKDIEGRLPEMFTRMVPDKARPD